MAADGVVEERGVDLAVEVFARQLFYRKVFAIGAVAFEVVVPLLQDKRNPAKFVFDQDDFQFRKRSSTPE